MKAVNKTRAKEPDHVNYIVTGSRYQVVNEKGEPLPETGVGVFRSGVQLEIARSLYRAMVSQRTAEKGFTTLQSAPERDFARKLAKSAFDYTDIFLEEMDKRMRRPAPPNDGDSP